VKVIGEGAVQGQFLTQPHTLKHLRTVQWRPKLLTRPGHEKWVQDGSTNLVDRAGKRLDQIIASHQTESLNQETINAISAVVTGYKG
jgi:trimethylamine---corrinoid protein Co-methyltransferase